MFSIKHCSALALVLGCPLGLANPGCRPNEGSALLRFPNEAARRAVVRLVVEVHSPDTGVVGSGGRSCEDFFGRAAAGEPAPGAPQIALLECEPNQEGLCEPGWFEADSGLRLPQGESIIYVQGFAAGSGGAPFLEGCTDRFDTEGGGDGADGAPIDLQLVLPGTTRLVFAGASRFVGRPAEPAPGGAQVRVEATEPTLMRTLYGIPGVTVRFEAGEGIALTSVPAGQALEIQTGADGRVDVPFDLPREPRVGFIEAISEEVALAREDGRASLRFVISALEVPAVREVVVRFESLARPVSVTMAPLASGQPPSLMVLGCEGKREEACRPGIEAPSSLPVARLSVFDNLAEAPVSVPVDGGLGVSPADVLVAPLLDSGPPTIAVLASRRAACQDRTCEDPATCPCWTLQSGADCPCEGSEIYFLQRNGARVERTDRITLTASNAVAMAAYRSQNLGRVGLAVAGQGRSRSERPCSDVANCLDYRGDECRDEPELCGCPPQERCECPGCLPGDNPVCVARDRMVDLVFLREGRLRNYLGCQNSSLSCDKQARTGACRCLDRENEGRCGGPQGSDACECPVPARIRVGTPNATSLPLDIVGARFSGAVGSDLIVVSSLTGLEFFDRSSGEEFQWRRQPLVNARIQHLAAANLDPNAEALSGGPPVSDLAWVAPGPCLRGVNLDAQCPVIRQVPDARGCFGVYVSDGLSDPTQQINERPSSRCRRYEVAALPTGVCAGDVDGNGNEDVAVVTDDADVRLFLGDGWGGMLDPPAVLEGPPGADGGRIACADVDGDGAVDLAVVDAQGRIRILRKQP